MEKKAETAVLRGLREGGKDKAALGLWVWIEGLGLGV